MFLSNHKYNKLNKSIAFRILRIIFLIYFFISMIFTFVSVYNKYKIERFTILQQLKTLENNIKLQIDKFVVRKDHKQIENSMRQLLSANAIVKGVEIFSYNSKEILYTSDDEANIDQKLSYSFIIKSNNFTSTDKLIKTIVYSNNTVVLNNIVEGFINSIIYFIIEIIILWGLLLWFSFKFILRNKKTSLTEIYFPTIITENNPFYLFVESFGFISTLINKNKKINNTDLKNTEQYLVDISNMIPSTIINLDQKCNITHINNAAEKFLGCDLQEVVGQPIQEVIIELEPYIGLMQYAIETKQFKTFNKIKIFLNDTEHFLKIVVYPFKSTDIALYIDDVTEQVFMENLLVQNEKMTTLGMLAAGMAHEINNPLSGILQSVQNITRRLDPKNEKNIAIAKEHGIAIQGVNQYLEARDINKFLQGIRELGEHAALVVKNVLKFSRRSDNDMVKICIKGVIQDALSIAATDYEMKKQLKYKELSIETELSANIPNVFCSPSEIEQVLLNLIKNAAHALAEKEFADGKPIILITTKVVEDNIKIEVKDNGPGIPDQIKEHLFKPFFTTKPIGVGTGLGLSISNYIISDKHHGKLRMESEIGIGSTFIIELPIIADEHTCTK